MIRTGYNLSYCKTPHKMGRLPFCFQLSNGLFYDFGAQKTHICEVFPFP